jgi:hypothetical protein
VPGYDYYEVLQVRLTQARNDPVRLQGTGQQHHPDTGLPSASVGMMKRINEACRAVG